MFCLNNRSLKLTLYFLKKQKSTTEFQEVCKEKFKRRGEVSNMSIFYNVFTIWILLKRSKEVTQNIHQSFAAFHTNIPQNIDTVYYTTNPSIFKGFSVTYYELIRFQVYVLYTWKNNICFQFPIALYLSFSTRSETFMQTQSVGYLSVLL